MTAATVLNYLFLAEPGIEVVTLTCSDGETFVSRKFKVISGALVTSNYNADAHINVSFSTTTATVNWAAQTDKTCTLVLWGQHS